MPRTCPPRAATVTSVTEEDLCDGPDLITPVLSPPPSPPPALSCPSPPLTQEPRDPRHNRERSASPVTRLVIPPLHPADLISLSLSLSSAPPSQSSARAHGLPASAPATPARFTPILARQRQRSRLRRGQHRPETPSTPSPARSPVPIYVSAPVAPVHAPVRSGGITSGPLVPPRSPVVSAPTCASPRPPPQIVHDLPGPRTLPRPAPTRATPSGGMRPAQEVLSGRGGNRFDAEHESFATAVVDNVSALGDAPVTFFAFALVSCVATLDWVAALMFAALAAGARGVVGSRTESNRNGQLVEHRHPVDSVETPGDDRSRQEREGRVDQGDFPSSLGDVVREEGDSREDAGDTRANSIRDVSDSRSHVGLVSSPRVPTSSRSEVRAAQTQNIEPQPQSSGTCPLSLSASPARRARVPPISIALVDSDSDDAEDVDAEEGLLADDVASTSHHEDDVVAPHLDGFEPSRGRASPTVSTVGGSFVSSRSSMPPRVATPIPSMVDSQHNFHDLPGQAGDRVTEGNRPAISPALFAFGSSNVPREVLVPRFSQQRRSTPRSGRRPLRDRESDPLVSTVPCDFGRSLPNRSDPVRPGSRERLQLGGRSSLSPSAPGNARMRPVARSPTLDREESSTGRVIQPGFSHGRRAPDRISPRTTSLAAPTANAFEDGLHQSSATVTAMPFTSRTRSPPSSSRTRPHERAPPRLSGATGWIGHAGPLSRLSSPQNSSQSLLQRRTVSPARMTGPRGNRALVPPDQATSFGPAMGTGPAPRMSDGSSRHGRRFFPTPSVPRSGTPPVGLVGFAASSGVESASNVSSGTDPDWLSSAPVRGPGLGGRSHRLRTVRSGFAVSPPRGRIDRASPGRSFSPTFFGPGDSGGSSDSDGVGNFYRGRRSQYVDSSQGGGLSHRNYSYSRSRSLRRNTRRDFNFRSTMEPNGGRTSDGFASFDLEIEEVNDDEFVDQDDEDDLVPFLEEMNRVSLHTRLGNGGNGRGGRAFMSRRYRRSDRDARTSRRVAPQEVIDRLRTFSYTTERTNADVEISADGVGPAAGSSGMKVSSGIGEGAGDDNSEPDRCAICFSEFEEGMSLRSLPCSHVFCGCVERWLATTANCPICRAPVLAEEDSRSPSSVSHQSTSTSSMADHPYGSPRAQSLLPGESGSTTPGIGRLSSPQPRRPFYF